MSGRIINILGVTGSIGRSTVQVIQHQPDCFDVNVITAHSNVEKLAELAVALNAKIAVITNSDYLADLQGLLAGTSIQASCDLDRALRQRRADVSVAAIVGMAGLAPLMTSIEMSSSVAIANKEPLVAAADLVLRSAQEQNCRILPLDSEHNAIFQVFHQDQKDKIERIILTASGGAFRGWGRGDMAKATPEQAMKHPTWGGMGRKITVDSASMMNKALEIIEACVLFDLPADKVEVIIHPQSLVHGMVEYADGSVLSQMGASDICTPIANIIHGDGQRLCTPGDKLSFTHLQGGLTFLPADLETYPALALAYDSIKRGQYACVALNAANEIAVDAFLNRKIGFLDILNVNEKIMETAPDEKFSTIEAIINYDKARRADAKAYIDRLK